LLLPRAAHAPAVAEGVQKDSVLPAVASVAKRRGDVLLVEDDVEVAALTREMLAALGFNVIHASNPAAALAKFSRASALEAVFSDIMMPGGTSGLHLAREIRARNPTLPIVLATGYAESGAAMRDGEFRLLLKPYSLEALADALGVKGESL
jgi:CheY-like chemotaxis protein